MAWLLDGEKISEDIFIRFGTTHERDGQMDRQTPGDGNSRAMHSSAWQKSVHSFTKYLVYSFGDERIDELMG